MEPEDLEHLKVCVTGAASGIGLEVARRFAEAGADVAITDLSPRIEEVAAQIGARAWSVADLAEEGDAARAVEDATAALDGLDCLVNVAGVQIVGLVSETEVSDWDRLMRINLRAPFLTCRAALPYLKASSRASIINTASVAGQRGGSGSTAYSASKGGLIAFGTALAIELAPDDITVNTVCPGWVDTGFNAPVIGLIGGPEAHAQMVRDGVPMGRQASAADIAPIYLFLASSGARYLTAKAIGVDGGLYN